MGNKSSRKFTKGHNHQISKNFPPAGAANMIPLESLDQPWQQITYPRGGGSSRARHSPKLRYTSPADNPIRTRRSGSCKAAAIELLNKFTPLGEQGRISGGRNNEALSSDILKEGSKSTSSSIRGSKSIDHRPLTPEIHHLLDKLETEKVKQARLLTEHLTRQRTFP